MFGVSSAQACPDSNRGLRDSVIGGHETTFDTHITKLPGPDARVDAIDEPSFHRIKSWLAKIEEAKIDEHKTSSSLSPQTATTSATALLTTSGPDSSLQPSSTHPVATAISSGDLGGGCGALTPSQPPANAQPAVNVGLNGSSNTVAASLRRLDFFRSASART